MPEGKEKTDFFSETIEDEPSRNVGVAINDDSNELFTKIHMLENLNNVGNIGSVESMIHVKAGYCCRKMIVVNIFYGAYDVSNSKQNVLVFLAAKLSRSQDRRHNLSHPCCNESVPDAIV